MESVDVDRITSKNESLLVAGNNISRTPIITVYFRINNRKCP